MWSEEIKTYMENIIENAVENGFMKGIFMDIKNRAAPCLMKLCQLPKGNKTIGT